MITFSRTYHYPLLTAHIIYILRYILLNRELKLKNNVFKKYLFLISLVRGLKSFIVDSILDFWQEVGKRLAGLWPNIVSIAV